MSNFTLPFPLIIDKSSSMSSFENTNITTALIDGVEVEYDGMSDYLDDSVKDFYSYKNGYEYLGEGVTHSHSGTLSKAPEHGFFWKNIPVSKFSNDLMTCAEVLIYSN